MTRRFHDPVVNIIDKIPLINLNHNILYVVKLFVSVQRICLARGLSEKFDDIFLSIVFAKIICNNNL